MKAELGGNEGRSGAPAGETTRLRTAGLAQGAMEAARRSAGTGSLAKPVGTGAYQNAVLAPNGHRPGMVRIGPNRHLGGICYLIPDRAYPVTDSGESG